jgi:deoxyhypusine synthase
MYQKKVKAIEVRPRKSISNLLIDMSKTGFQGRSLARVVEVLDKMITDKKITVMLGYAGSLSTTGQWRIINWLIERGYVDVLVSTGANISEDIVEAMGKAYYQGSHVVDNIKVFRDGYNRYYDVYGNEKDYMKMTTLITDFMVTLDENHKYSSREFLMLLGKWLLKKKIPSIVATAAKHNVPVFCPAIVDSPYGDAALVADARGFKLMIDAVKDYVEFMSLARHVNETAVIYIGGGVPKDFLQLFAVTSDLLYLDREIPGRKGGVQRPGDDDETYYPHSYAVQITSDSPQWGGLSGCTFEEAITWGKESQKGDFVQCYCDATIALPIVSHALAERIKGKRKGKQLNRVL